MAAQNKLLPFIKDSDLFAAVKVILNLAQYAGLEDEEYKFRNSIDPFSALFDAALQNITLEEWLTKETFRQMQKTLQNCIGDFHQTILGSVPGWENLNRGKVFDIRNTDKKIIAEIKNKYNTTKGNHKTAIYDDLSAQLKGNYKGYTAYYVEIIPQSKKIYNKEFAPSDNKTKKRRPVNKNIRVVDGKTFYEIVTGDPLALNKLYYVLPEVISDLLGKKLKTSKEDTLFRELFEKIY